MVVPCPTDPVPLRISRRSASADANLFGDARRSCLPSRSRSPAASIQCNAELNDTDRRVAASISRRLSPGQLREGHGAELLRARQAAHAGIAGVTLHDASEARPRYRAMVERYAHVAQRPCRGQQAGSMRSAATLWLRLKAQRPSGFAKPLIELVGPEGFEPSTNGLRVRCSTN